MRTAVPIGIVAVLLVTGCATGSQVPPGISDEEAARLILVTMRDDVAELQRRVPGASAPSSVGEEIAENWEDWVNLQAYCMTSAGFGLVSITKTSFMVGGDGDLVRQARVHCAYRFPLDPRLRGALSSEQAEYAWDYWDTRLIPCVEALGYSVPAVPQRTEFIRNAVGRVGQLPWTPYLAMRVQSNEEKAAIDAVCPPLPDNPYNLYDQTRLPTLIILGPG